MNVANSVVTNIGPSAVLKSPDLEVSATITQEQQLNAESDVGCKDIELPRISNFDFGKQDRQDYANKLQEYQSVKNAQSTLGVFP